MIFYSKVRNLQQKRNEHDPELQERYLPSTGSEGMDFEGWWCEGGCGAPCRSYVNRKEGYTDCRKGILIHQHGLAEPGDRRTWHKAWREVNGQPTCTAYRARNSPSDNRAMAEREAYVKAMNPGKDMLRSVPKP